MMNKIKIFTKLLVIILPVALHSPTFALNIGPLLDTCPDSDPFYTQIRSDFEIRRNGTIVQDVSCSEPVSQMPLSQYTDELIVLQGLRAILYMDLGFNDLPWYSGTLYEWMDSKNVGINISDTAAFSSCCMTIDGKLFFTMKAQDDFSRDFDHGWMGISGNIGLYAHEIRHLDGFPHVSCCGISGGCDQSYDEANLSPYGIQWWLNAHWLTGELYTGFSCLDPIEVDEITDWHLSSTNVVFRDRFCDNIPPLLITPEMPGGECLVQVEDCSDGVDNDEDGFIDCADQDCATDSVCMTPDTETDCSDGVDDDGDGFIDCTDSDCSADPSCSQKVIICHIPPGNSNNAKTKTINAISVADHLGHGDLLGPCP